MTTALLADIAILMLCLTPLMFCLMLAAAVTQNRHLAALLMWFAGMVEEYPTGTAASLMGSFILAAILMSLVA